MKIQNSKYAKERKKPLRFWELLAIALGGMIGGGIFSILGISVEKIGNATPIAFLIGGGLAFLAAYSYVQLALYYKDEGATYSFFKRTFPASHFSASVIGWFVVFGYISTLALYAFTFASYLASILPVSDYNLYRNLLAGGVLGFFSIINIVSVKGMGKLEDFIVYLKLALLLAISVVLANKGDIQNMLPLFDNGFDIKDIFIISSLTFVAYEGFQLVIHATKEMENPKKNTSKAIYSAIGIATLFYVILSTAAIVAISKADLIMNKEYAFAAGASTVLGQAGLITVIFGALLATMSAINGTIFGASRLIAVIADDRYLPKFLSKRRNKNIPYFAIIMMFVFSYVFVLYGNLESILKFGSITFLLVSFLMAFANFKIRKKTHSNSFLAFLAMLGLSSAGGTIIYYEYTTDTNNLLKTLLIYLLLAFGAWLYAKKNKKQL